MSVERIPFVLSPPHEDEIHGDLYIATDAVACPLIIMVHGYTGFKDWGSLPAQCEWFAEHGMAAVAFNFSHNGIAEDPMRITDSERFAQNTISRELDELECIVTAALEGKLPGASRYAANKIVLLGHSRGGAEAIIIGKEQRSIRAVAAWGSIDHFDRWSAQQKSQWRADGRKFVHNSRLDMTLEMSVNYLHDLELNVARFNVGMNAATMRKPLLLVHGAQDVTVAPKEARQLYQASSPATTRLVIIPAAGHTFGSDHPFTTMPTALEAALEATLAFFQETLATR